jgi:hypothetical protein
VVQYNDLSSALRKARLAEAAHFEAVQSLTDSKSLRLQVLKDDLAPLVAATPDAVTLFDLALVPGETPRLWVDLISSVVMEPDYRTYRLCQDSDAGRQTLFETANRGEMADYVKAYMAHRMVARAKTAAAAGRPFAAAQGYSTGAVIYAWFTGFTLGILMLILLAIHLGFLKI